MPKLKRFIAIILSISIAIGVSGCMGTTASKNNPESIKEQTMNYLKNKYNEEFEPVYLSTGSWAYSYDELSVQPKGREDERFYVRRSQNKETKIYGFHDNYFGYLIRSDYEAAVSGFVKEYYDEFKLYCNFGEGMLDDSLGPNSTLEDFLNIQKKFAVDVQIFVKGRAQKDDGSLRKLAEKLYENNFCTDLTINYAYEDKYEAVSREKLDEIFNHMEDWYDYKESIAFYELDQNK